VKAPPLAVEHDAVLIGQVLLNLLLNAIQSIEGEGAIEIRVGSDSHNALVSVRDTGKGIPAAQIAQVFRPFFTTKKSGTGLGLYISRELARSVGGDLRHRRWPQRAGGRGALGRVLHRAQGWVDRQPEHQVRDRVHVPVTPTAPERSAIFRGSGPA